MKRNSQQGVALVITLILLSVITFMAVTFLVVTRREREQTTTQLNQTDARLAADAAVEQAKATILASMLARTNGQDFGLVVSTNFINPAGFDPIQSTPDLINVNYDHLLNGNPLGVGDRIANIANLQILPRPPVYVTTNKNPVFPPDFRFYLDLNRNGAFDTNGFGTNYDLVGGVFTFLQENGKYLTNFFVGDPEWIGVLDKPYYPHSSSNFFTARFAYFAVPIGNDLDLNYIHNSAKRPPKNSEGFLRNEGVGSWEINLAAFLFYLNTNAWGNIPSVSPYGYTTNMALSSTGNAFKAAFGLLTYRYDNGINRSWGTLNNAHNDFAGFADQPFGNDFIDEYVNGPLWTTATRPQIDLDTNLLALPWSGSDNPAHFFTTQDLFNPEANNGNMNFFTGPLLSAGTNLVSSYDRYTFYRLWQQMGVESAPETSGKVNLNYDTVHSKPNNFVHWTPVSFFTNAADAMLRALVTNTDSGTYPTDLSITNIPIYPTNFYTPAVHRLLQLAANIYDASTNRMFNVSSCALGPAYPSVFRPILGANGTNLFIKDYQEVTTTNDGATLTRPLALPDDIKAIIQNINAGSNNINIYGVPYVIGAKKGFPNFNEFTYQTVSQITRRVEIDKVTTTTPPSGFKTNQMFQVGVSNVIGIEAWNSYSTPYPRPINVIMADDLRMYLTVTNTGNTNPVFVLPLTNTPGQFVVGTNFLFPSCNTWPGFPNSPSPGANAASFFALSSNVVFIPDLVYVRAIQQLVGTNAVSAFEPVPLPTDPVPHFVLTVSNRFRFLMVDPESQRIVDYVQLESLNSVRDLTSELVTNDTLGVWDTNFDQVTKIPSGPNQQIQIALGNRAISTVFWNNAQIQQYTDQSKAAAIQGFSDWYNNQPQTAADLVRVAPFTPTAKNIQAWTWQANDPLVHYTQADLYDTSQLQGTLSHVIPPNNNSLQGTNALLPNIARVNVRYHPWGYTQNQNGDPGLKDLTYKDPLIFNSDSWDFMTNAFGSAAYPNIGWLGRVHRGTPWQTVYLKSAMNTNVAAWRQWTGNTNQNDSVASMPTNDWKIIDLFTTAPNDNAARGRLSVNQTNFPAWAAIFNGVITLTPTNDPVAGLTNIPVIIDQDANDPNLATLINAINNWRTKNTLYGVFTNLGDILAVPELTVNSPYIVGSPQAANTNLSDAVYERLPQQVLGLLKVGQPRYVIYAYGQSLKPADHSLVTSGSYFGLCTNYQITGEVATRTVVRIDNAPIAGSTKTFQPRAVVESFNVIPPE